MDGAFSEQKPAFMVDPEHLVLEEDSAVALGQRLHAAYVAAEPYPYTVIDNAFSDALVERLRAEVASVEDLVPGPSVEGHEFKKSQLIAERLPVYARNFCYVLNSRPFLRFLEALTGIKGLIPDPYYMGGGLHSTGTGGFLKMHADFNLHKPLNLERRLNVLLYLNPDWKEEYGGCFEIWDTDMKKRYQKLAPLMNRLVVFTTASDTMHGNPEPVQHPDGEPRRSIALYYYTATWDDSRFSHTTMFKGRPGTGDKSGFGQKLDRFYEDVTPPILRRAISKMRRKAGI